MAYFIFSKNLPNIRGTLYKITENISDLDNIIKNKEVYNIVETTQSNFDSLKFGTKIVISYDTNNNLIFEDIGDHGFRSKIELDNYIFTLARIFPGISALLRLRGLATLHLQSSLANNAAVMSIHVWP